MFTALISGFDLSSYDDIWLANIPRIIPSEMKREIHDVYMFDGGMSDKNFYRGKAQLELTFHSTDFDKMLGLISANCVEVVQLVTRAYSDYEAYIYIYETGQTYTQGYRYNIINATITSIDRRDSDYGRVTVVYDILPYRYDGTYENYETISGGNTERITTPSISMPLYQVVATGAGTIELSSSENNFQILGACTIDIDSKRMVTMSDGVVSENLVNGNYEDLWIYDIADITVSSNLTVKVYPRKGIPL